MPTVTIQVDQTTLDAATLVRDSLVTLRHADPNLTPEHILHSAILLGIPLLTAQWVTAPIRHEDKGPVDFIPGALSSAPPATTDPTLPTDLSA